MNEMISLQTQEALINGYTGETISKLIEQCTSEPDIDKKIQLFHKINSSLPKQYRVNIPSLITDDYIDTALYRIYQNMQVYRASS
ncbi:MAG TPA: hypothetical protein VFS97_04155 [Nitrososphaeraceae archaeon]|nr:hypothetical protein [Nitrososphaeraceae archaeon]